MAFDEAFAERIRRGLARKDSLIVRLDPEGYDDALLEPHVSEFNITGRAMKGWVLVAPQGSEDDD